MSSERNKSALRVRGNKTMWKCVCGLDSSLLGCLHLTDAQQSCHILFTLALRSDNTLLGPKTLLLKNRLMSISFTRISLHFFCFDSVLLHFSVELSMIFLWPWNKFQKCGQNLVNHWQLWGLLFMQLQHHCMTVPDSLYMLNFKLKPARPHF